MPSRRPKPVPVRADEALGFLIWKVHGDLAMTRAHTHADIEMNFVIDGELSYLHGGAVVGVKPLCFTVLWGGVPHYLPAPAPVKKGIWMTIPLGTFLRWELPTRMVTRLFGGEIVAAPKNAIDGVMIERWLQDYESKHPGRRKALLLEIEARFHRLAWESAGRPARSRNARSQAGAHGMGGLRHMERITEYIAQHYREPLAIDEIAGALKLHGKYLMRLFKQHSRMSVWEYVTRIRLANAQRLLLTSGMKITDVALESGFGSLGPFYRAFAEYSAGAKTPSEYRKQAARA